MELEELYRHRISDAERREMALVWQVLVEDYFSRWIKPDFAVLDYGAGTCQFINNVRSRRRVAFDANPAVRSNCATGVEFIEGVTPTVLAGQKFDVIFVSNFLEHLENSNEVVKLLGSLRELLTDSGSILILQPNFTLVGPRYFDFIDHRTILTDRSLDEALTLTGYRISFMKIRFLPYTSKSRLPKTPWLVRAYLRMPLAQYFIGKQTFVVATSRAPSSAGQSRLDG